MLHIALRLAGRAAVVVGGGRAALRKVRALLQAGARVTVVAPELAPALERLAAAGTIAVRTRCWTPADTAGAFLVVTCAGDPAVNAAAAAFAAGQGALVCRADCPEAGDLHLLATVRRGPLTLAVGSDGLAPALTQAVRRRLATQYGPEWAEYAALVAEARRQLRAAGLPEPVRRAVLCRLCQTSELSGLATAARAAGAAAAVSTALAAAVAALARTGAGAAPAATAPAATAPATAVREEGV